MQVEADTSQSFLAGMDYEADDDEDGGVDTAADMEVAKEAAEEAAEEAQEVGGEMAAEEGTPAGSAAEGAEAVPAQGGEAAGEAAPAELAREPEVSDLNGARVSLPGALTDPSFAYRWASMTCLLPTIPVRLTRTTSSQ